MNPENLINEQREGEFLVSTDLEKLDLAFTHQVVGKRSLLEQRTPIQSF